MIYEYVCPICGLFEVHQNIKDEQLKVCPTRFIDDDNIVVCDKPLKKLMSHGYFYFNHNLKH